ncbi:hypothetical protein BAUCODRAFT_574828 [Baudoinia panamericana UAMH 10762]|uniref:Wings apart-like protein C-terminal domain-containing protein n=1 Tax=Baudoinia panamericana (strain UAMH 10762) TaxID=717646 RepID=M2NDQ2_BAUPA|nr:uncharacterized protein BAUCODRAFT_574828 [Baudoinia panamericana UAMH 10762]EMC97020.1 hypothetical protein BAUCODRAFT_574828 [Baudoinia panamericana UAMH 10762]
MAAVSAMPTERPRKMIKYGRTTSRSGWNNRQQADAWFDDDDNAMPARRLAMTREPAVTATYKVQKPTHHPAQTAQEYREAKKSAPRPVAKRVKQHDMFDVPSSDEEPDCDFIIKRTSPPKPNVRSSLRDDADDRTETLAPWERELESAGLGLRGVGVVDAMHAMLSPPRVAEEPSRAATATTASPAASAHASMTAAARLTARRNRTDVNASANATSNKRIATASREDAETPRKKARRQEPSNTERDPPVLNNQHAKAPVAKPGVHDPDIDVYDVPLDDELSTTSRSAPLSASRVPRPRQPPSKTPMPKQGLSAPARLAEMLPVEAEDDEAITMSPTATPCTPRRSATPHQAPGKPATVVKRAGAVTPKQRQLWSQLLPSDATAPSPSSLAMKELTLSGRARTVGNAASLVRTLTKARSDVPELHRRRTRVVDRLKASVREDTVESDEDSGSADHDEPALNCLTKRQNSTQSAVSTPDTTSRSQGHSQTQAAPSQAGPRITYAAVRSHLQDSIEDSVLFDPSPVAPPKPSFVRQTSKQRKVSQKSTFDLDDSDEEGGTSQVRSIHELRAAGRSRRFMEETEALLDEIADHSISARSRRRSALVELATKLKDRAYVERFLSQGYEHKLIIECSAPPDEVADFVLAAAFALPLNGELPEHTVRALKMGVITWLASLLTVDVPVRKMMKDRKHNIAKAAQAALVEFAHSLATHLGLNASDQQEPLTLRLVALLALDKLVGKLRHLGDTTELLEHDQLLQVLRYEAETDEFHTHAINIAVSLLESLASSAMILDWPSALLARLASLLPTLANSDNIPQHTLFLALRLTLNLTTANTTHCNAFAKTETMQYLLHSINTGFAHLNTPPTVNDQPTSHHEHTLSHDFLILSLGSAINLASSSTDFRAFTISSPNALTATTNLTTTLQQAQNRMSDAETLPETTSNIAYGYLAVLLANLCQTREVRDFIAARLERGRLDVLVQAVEEFVGVHERVDLIAGAAGVGGGGGIEGGIGGGDGAVMFEGREGAEVMGAFTERLRGVLGRLREVAGV